MFMHGGIGGFRTSDRHVADGARDFLGAFQRGGETRWLAFNFVKMFCFTPLF